MQGDGAQEEADYMAEQEAEAQAQGEAEQSEYEARKAEEGFQKEQELEAMGFGAPTNAEEDAASEKESFEQDIRELKVLRDNELEYNTILTGLQISFAEKHKNMIHSMATIKEAIGKLEASIKTKALNQYEEDGEKKLAFGVGIQVKKDVLFDDDLAFAWAKETGLCLKLDLSAFKKIAKVQKIKWTYIGDRTIATIPTDIKI